MKGVAFGVDRTLPLHDLTHEIPAYNIWEASYRLYQTLQYWPAGTVFVSVVAAPGLEYHRLAFGADTGVHHADEDGTLKGTIPILDVQYGNVWTISTTAC